MRLCDFFQGFEDVREIGSFKTICFLITKRYFFFLKDLLSEQALLRLSAARGYNANGELPNPLAAHQIELARRI